MGIEQNLAKSIQARIFTSGEISGFRMISSLNHFRPKFWTEGDLGISLSLSVSLSRGQDSWRFEGLVPPNFRNSRSRKQIQVHPI
jgi:hypothetical protein